ncbi:retron system putative HNH endonuclease [Mangrovibacter plantisponsor]|uniref:Uncharacterized protein (TIGR02646 family) n=1 Tax=Mangrovibacter plantisponsor TaxID=451513 RepID=A0A317PYL0_9ENTR|nr:retron system putative HNH endonuclease [Mangrovibacter plantisponsor]PWW06692.1 uncharacterized protein (TIGR02646 family) [Mangrovibacter plantisponsor]
MRRIKKQVRGNANLAAAQANNGIPATHDAARRAWKNFRDNRNTLFHQLLVEQFGLCCYTELNLADIQNTHGIGSHFEHEQPKSLFPARTFDELNLLRSALSDQDLKTYTGSARFAGHHKGSLYNPNLFISPQSANCRDYFVYLPLDGSIQPKSGLSAEDTAKADYTITLLNLNAPFLIAERRRWLKEIEDEITRLINDNAVEAVRHLAECELTLTPRKHPQLIQPAFAQLRAFHSATRALFGSLGEQVIQQHCAHID